MRARETAPRKARHPKGHRKDVCRKKVCINKFGRGERIRTSGLYVPNVALYQAKLHPDCSVIALPETKLRQWLRSTAKAHNCIKESLNWLTGSEEIEFMARCAAFFASCFV